MTYLIDLHHLGAQQTGNETWTANIARELARSGLPDGTFTYAVTAAGRERARELGCAPLRSISASSVRRLAVDLPRLGTDADALLVHYTLPPGSHRIGKVVLVHDLSFEHPHAARWLPPASRLRMRRSVRLSVNRADVVLAPSEFTRREIAATYDVDPARILVAGNAVDPDLARRLDEQAASVRRQAGRVLLVGNLLPRKNARVVAMAVRLLRDRGAEATLRVVGRVDRRQATLAAEMSALLGDAVSFSGYVSQDRLAREYLEASVFCFPSLYEGFGIPTLEAMQAGVPTIVADSTALPEVAGVAALTADPTEPEDWAAKIATALTSGSSMTTLGRQRAEAYSWSESARVVTTALERADAKRAVR
ncbi:glycosyltransferase family 4 protein [Cryptosporangium sp. NPDC048952]|uniref:glycosyltransferase family 4 protein n=1 Tax=Cryptosporangium sp. NPDC048952 TaxID=3363961 RepID=UPI003711F72D